MKNKLLVLIAFPLFALFSMSADAAEGWTGYRKISDFGCHLLDGTCYVSLENISVGPAQCTQSSIRWNSQTNTNGKTWVALITAAQLSGRRVGLYVAGCYPDNPLYPTFAYGSVEP